jgi:hypothetical protein
MVLPEEGEVALIWFLETSSAFLWVDDFLISCWMSDMTVFLYIFWHPKKLSSVLVLPPSVFDAVPPHCKLQLKSVHILKQLYTNEDYHIEAVFSDWYKLASKYAVIGAIPVENICKHVNLWTVLLADEHSCGLKMGCKVLSYRFSHVVFSVCA